MKTTDWINEYNKRRDAISRDPALSDTGRSDAFKKLQTEAAEYKPRAMAILKDDMDKAKNQFKAVLTKRALIFESEAKRWDFNRLNYTAQKVRDMFDGAADPADAGRIYSNLRNSADLHERRAAAESKAAIVKRWGHRHTESSDLVRRMEADLEAMQPHELKSIETEANNAVNLILTTVKDIDNAAAFYNTNALDSSGGDFVKIKDGVRISQRIDPAATDSKKMFKITVDID
jgi:hypothetical protein